MGVCENHIMFCLVFHFHPPWAIFSFHNPVALVCGGYVMRWYVVALSCGLPPRPPERLPKSEEFSSQVDLELHFSGLDLNIRFVVCATACLWVLRSVTEQYVKFLNPNGDLNDIRNDIWTTSERHPKSSQVIIDPFDPFWFSFLIWILRRTKKRQEYM